MSVISLDHVDTHVFDQDIDPAEHCYRFLDQAASRNILAEVSGNASTLLLSSISHDPFHAFSIDIIEH